MPLVPGIYPMVYSFFNRDSNLRLDAFEVQAETVAQSAAAGSAALGIGSEASKLSLSERLDTDSRTLKM